MLAKKLEGTYANFNLHTMDLQQRYSEQPEFLQAVHEVLEDVCDIYKTKPEYIDNSVVDYLLEPDRIINFRVSWRDDDNKLQVNRGFRVQYCNALGPYKGGLRFHPSVNVGILKFLGFEQCFKNALTSLPLGGAKGGADFDPKGKSEGEIMRFCQSFMDELVNYIGYNTDVPAGDIGVGASEIGYMYGRFLKLRNQSVGVLTGKGLNYGGSFARTEATGFGAVYFLCAMLKAHKKSLKGKVVLISGSGNVALHAAQKCIEMGAIVRTVSDSKGIMIKKDGFSLADIEAIKKIKLQQRKRLKDSEIICKKAEYQENENVWSQKGDIAMPCATQNEMDLTDIQRLHKNGVFAVVEGANMPLTSEAQNFAKEAGIMHGSGKAANAGGVAVSGLEMAQNSMRTTWEFEKVDAKLQQIMQSIHDTCHQHSDKVNGVIAYPRGANIASFTKLADTVIALGMK